MYIWIVDDGGPEVDIYNIYIYNIYIYNIYNINII